MFHINYLVPGTDFTVLVQNVPPRVTELEISNHFSTVLGADVVEVRNDAHAAAVWPQGLSKHGLSLSAPSSPPLLAHWITA